MSYWKNKVVLVTGGSSGLGRAIAESFAARGARVVIAARGAAQLEAVSQVMRDAGGDVTPVVADVTQDEQVQALLARTVELHGRLHVLVNGVGQSTRGYVADATPDEFAQLMELNLLTAVRCTRAALPHLLESKGHLVNIGSLASKIAARYLAAYPASKFALAAYTAQLRLELEPAGLHVLLVCPGPIANDRWTDRYVDQARGLPESARHPGAGVKLSAIPLDGLASRVVSACERRKAELVVPARARLLAAVSQLWPRLGDWVVRKKT